MKTKQTGSRTLTKNEIYTILPTYDRIEEQIKSFRKQVLEFKENINKYENYDYTREVFGFVKKYNNISIVGKRGSGKTSIITSIYNKLKEENNKYKDKKLI